MKTTSDKIAESWGELPEKLGTIKQRKCHGIVWRFDLMDTRTGDTVKQANSEAKLRLWAEANGWVISRKP